MPIPTMPSATVLKLTGDEMACGPCVTLCMSRLQLEAIRIALAGLGETAPGEGVSELRDMLLDIAEGDDDSDITHGLTF